MITGIILAGGNGSRTGWDLPKQFVEIDGQPMILYSLKVFQASPSIQKIVVVCKSDYIDYFKNSIKNSGLTKPVQIVEGGKTHQDSLTNALEYINVSSIDDDDIVVIHNANRPLVTIELVEDSINICKIHGCGISALACVDSMMYSENGTESNLFLDRNRTIRAQSPQAYRLKELYYVYSQAQQEGIHDSYECELMTKYGKQIFFSKGLETNIKLTTAEDLMLVTSLLHQKELQDKAKQKRQLQRVCTEIMDVIFALCKKHNLQCFLAYGTLLGAVRHRGFIPWDDDIDLMMPIEDYRKLEEVLKQELPEQYFLQTFETDRFYGLNWMKIRKNGTTCVDERWQDIPCHCGIDVDIFQISRVPNNFILRKLWLFAYRTQWALLESIIVEGKQSLLTVKKKKILYRALIHIPYSIRRLLIKTLDPIAFGRGKIKTKNVIIGTKNKFYPAEWFKSSVEVEFEGKSYPAPNSYIQYLSARYGDFMKLPAVNHRNGKNFANVDLEHQHSFPISPVTCRKEK